jgi:uncharacterized damage-inducible protein DinB
MTDSVFRPGALGALMDEYARAVWDLARMLEPLTQAQFEAVRDRTTRDEDCRSIQTVMAHVIRAGYGYIGYMRSAFESDAKPPVISVDTPAMAIEQLGTLVAYTAAVFEGRWTMPDEVIEAARIQSRWGPIFNLEQMFEHAIVHVLRHRRQIERFLIESRFQPLDA